MECQQVAPDSAPYLRLALVMYCLDSTLVCAGAHILAALVSHPSDDYTYIFQCNLTKQQAQLSWNLAEQTIARNGDSLPSARSLNPSQPPASFFYHASTS